MSATREPHCGTGEPGTPAAGRVADGRRGAIHTRKKAEMTCEQHLPYRATGDVVVLDGDGSRWVREHTCRTVSKCCVAHIYVDKDEVVRKILDEYCPNCRAKAVADAIACNEYNVALCEVEHRVSIIPTNDPEMCVEAVRRLQEQVSERKYLR